jgi:hypothetical protein
MFNFLYLPVGKKVVVRTIRSSNPYCRKNSTTELTQLIVSMLSPTIGDTNVRLSSSSLFKYDASFFCK